MYWQIAVILLGLAILWGWRRGMRPAPNKIESPDDVINALRYLFVHGIEGGTCRFQVGWDSGRSVLFSKHIIAPGSIDLRARCIDLPEAKPRLDAFTTELHRRGIPSVRKDESTLRVDCGDDLGLGVMVVTLAFQELFKSKLSDHCVAFFDGVVISNSPSLTGIEESKL